MGFLIILLGSFFLLSCQPVEKKSFSAVSLLQNSAAIYDLDSRQEVSLSPPLSPVISSAILVSQDRLQFNSNGTASFRKFPLSKGYLLCSDERFQDQVLLGFCSGVLVHPQIVLTAGHCVRSARVCAETRLVFAFNLEKSKQAALGQKEVYACSQVLAIDDSPTRGGHDYALIKLDRPVLNARPVRLAISKTVTLGTPVVSLSYPLGLPLKSDQGRITRNESWSNFIETEVDTFSGSSGSGLFNTSGELLGILSRGSEDILEDDIQRVQKEGGCLRFHRCHGTCRGEKYYRIDSLIPLIPRF